MARRNSTKRTLDFDRGLGDRIRQRRILAGLSQEKLADAIGLTFQQVQKYERGHNRVSVGMLRLIARAIGCSMLQLIDDAGDGAAPAVQPIARKELELIKNWQAIPEGRIKQQVYGTIAALAAASPAREAA